LNGIITAKVGLNHKDTEAQRRNSGNGGMRRFTLQVSAHARRDFPNGFSVVHFNREWTQRGAAAIDSLFPSWPYVQVLV
jgi:hypothetical protein